MKTICIAIIGDEIEIVEKHGENQYFRFGILTEYRESQFDEVIELVNEGYEPKMLSNLITRFGINYFVNAFLMEHITKVELLDKLTNCVLENNHFTGLYDVENKAILRHHTIGPVRINGYDYKKGIVNYSKEKAAFLVYAKDGYETLDEFSYLAESITNKTKIL